MLVDRRLPLTLSLCLIATSVSAQLLNTSPAQPIPVASGPKTVRDLSLNLGAQKVIDPGKHPLQRFEFPADLPQLPPEMPGYVMLPDSREALISRVNTLLAQSSALKLSEPVGDELVVARDPKTKTVHAWVNSKTGDVEIYAPLTSNEGVAMNPQALTGEFAKPIFANVPQGSAGELFIAHTRTLRHAQVKKLAGSPDKQVIKTASSQVLYVSAQRQLPAVEYKGKSFGPFRVEGAGERSTVALGPDGSVKALAMSYRVVAQTLVLTRHGSDLRQRIAAALKHDAQRSTITILAVTPVYYYHGATSLLQPAYRFLARLNPDEGDGDTTARRARHILGYVPFSGTAELAPLAKISDELPQPVSETSKAAADRQPISIGRYVSRNWESGFARNASEFWAALQDSATVLPIYDAEYQETPADIFKRRERSIHGVHLALVEAHGVPGGIATNGHRELAWLADLNNASEPRNVKRSMDRLWVFHSCEVVSSPDDVKDLAEWAKPWWPVVATVPTVVGYRTPMYIHDGAGFAYGTSLALDAPMRSAWLNDVAALPAYGDNPYGCSEHVRRSLGQPAVVAACHVPDGSLSSIGANKAPAASSEECLDVWWLSNSLPRNATTVSDAALQDPQECMKGLPTAAVVSEYRASCVPIDCTETGGFCGADCSDNDVCMRRICYFFLRSP